MLVVMAVSIVAAPTGMLLSITEPGMVRELSQGPQLQAPLLVQPSGQPLPPHTHTRRIADIIRIPRATSWEHYQSCAPL